MLEEMWSSFSKFVADFAVTSGARIIGALLILFIGFKIAKFIIKGMSKAKWFEKLEPTVQSFSRSFIGTVLRIIVVFIAATELGVDNASILAVLGSAGIAIGLALQGGLTNIAGGVIIMLFKPFRVGDYITAGANSGTVTEIDIFHTTLLTPDKKKIIIPNGELSNSAITNFSSEPKRRVDFAFTVAYDSDIDLVRKVLLAAAANHALVIKGEEDCEPVVYLTKYGDSALEFALRVWCASGDYWTVNFDLMEDVKRAFDQFGITIPYPQLDVHLDGADSSKA